MPEAVANERERGKRLQPVVLSALCGMALERREAYLLTSIFVSFDASKEMGNYCQV